MSFRPNTRFRERHANVHSNYGGIGDAIARLPAIRWIMREQPHIRMTVYWHDYFFELAHVLLPPNEQFRYLPKSHVYWADGHIPMINFTPETVSSSQFDLVDYAFIRICQRLPPTPEDKFYPKIPTVPKEKKIIIAPCYTSETRKWKGEFINLVAKGIKDLGFEPVFLGETQPYAVGNGETTAPKLPEGIDLTLGTDKINKLSLVETLHEINRASAIVGLDNGLLHLSACTDTPSVWGFTSVYSHLRIPKDVKHSVITADVSCYGCQSRAYLLDHDFRECINKDYACLDTMKAEKFLDGLKKVLALDT